MKKFLPVFGMGLLILNQASFAQDPGQAEHIFRNFGQVSVDIYGYRNSVANFRDLSAKPSITSLSRNKTALKSRSRSSK